MYCISDKHSGSPKNWSFPEPSFFSSMRRKKLAGSGKEIDGKQGSKERTKKAKREERKREKKEGTRKAKRKERRMESRMEG